MRSHLCPTQQRASLVLSQAGIKEDAVGSQAVRSRLPLQLARPLRPVVVAFAAAFALFAVPRGAFTAPFRQPSLSQGPGGTRGAPGSLAGLQSDLEIGQKAGNQPSSSQPLTARQFFGSETEDSFQKTVSDFLAPTDPLFQVSEDGMVVTEMRTGSRDYWASFWAIAQPLAAAGFLVVGLSTYFNTPIVDMNPVTKELFGYLRPTAQMKWFPQGAFMTFYGFFGLFLFGPVQWYIQLNNPGYGGARFDAKTQKFQQVMDGKMIQEVDFDDIQQVKMEWSNSFFGGTREVYFIMKDGTEVHWMDTSDEIRQIVLENRATILANLLDKELIVDIWGV